MRDADDTASWVTAITTIANYALLIVVGFLRDLLCGKGRTEAEGYAPLLNDWQVSLRCPRRPFHAAMQKKTNPRPTTRTFTRAASTTASRTASTAQSTPPQAHGAP